MSRKKRTYDKIMSGYADKSIDFNELRYLLISLGFRERIRGDHYFMSKEGIEEPTIRK